jgi:hypothetical protein
MLAYLQRLFGRKEPTRIECSQRLRHEPTDSDPQARSMHQAIQETEPRIYFHVDIRPNSWTRSEDQAIGRTKEHLLFGAHDQVSQILREVALG